MSNNINNNLINNTDNNNADKEINNSNNQNSNSNQNIQFCKTYNMSSVTLHFLVKEFQSLVDSKLDQIYQIEKNELILIFHSSIIGKKILRIINGRFPYITSIKGSMPSNPHGFCIFLRKQIKNARLKALHQLGFERILELEFELKFKDSIKSFFLILEFFGGGNIIVLNKDHFILSAFDYPTFKDRIIRPKEPYSFPKKEFDFLTIKKEQLTSLLKSSKKENLVKSLALELGLGGVFAEEICILAKLDKSKKASDLSSSEILSLFETIEKLHSKKISPEIISKQKEIIDIVPFRMDFYKNMESKSFPTLSEAFDSVFTQTILSDKKTEQQKIIKSKLSRVQEIVDAQNERITHLGEEEKIDQRKGEVIYENYQMIDKILFEIKEARKTMSWKEIKDKLRNHKIIKSIDEKTGEIVIELN